MKETSRISGLFSALYNGEPWIEVSILSVLKSLSAQQAARRIIPNVNTIWEITNHLIEWRKTLLQRLKGEMIESPDHNYFQEVTDISPSAWELTLSGFGESQEIWLQYLQSIPESKLEETYPETGMSFYEFIHGIIQHDAYHLGQIVLLRKLA